MSMSLRHKRLIELKQSGQAAEFRLSDGTTIVGVVQDVDANDVWIVSGGAERIIAHSAIAQINISGIGSASSYVETRVAISSGSDALSELVRRAQQAVQEARWTNMELPKPVERLSVLRSQLLGLPGQLWTAALNYMRDRAWQSAAQKFFELGRVLGNNYEPYYNAAICYAHAAEFAVSTLLFEQTIRLNNNRDAFTGGVFAALKAQLWHKATAWMIELFLMTRGEASTHSALDYALRLGLYQTAINALQQALLKQIQLSPDWLSERIAYVAHQAQLTPALNNEVAHFCRTPDLESASALLNKLSPVISDQPTLDYRTAQGTLTSLLERYPQYDFNKLDKLYEQAEQMRQANRLQTAKDLFEELLKLDPRNQRAQSALRDLESRLALPQYPIHARTYTPRPKPASASVPRDGGYYARAKHAELEEKDFATAEEYFREAIRNNDRAESAVKDLASLLNQQGRTEEAIRELETFLRANRVSNLLSFRNQLITLYQRAGNFARAIELIDANLSALPSYRRHVALQQKAYCQMQLDQLEEAEKTLQQVLRLAPANDVAQRWLEGVQQTLQSGTKLSAIISIEKDYNELQADRTISPFLRFYIERCAYEGIPDARRATRAFTDDDLNKLEDLLKAAGLKRLSQRADLWLTKAAVAERLGKESSVIHEALYKYALNMAEASAVDNKHLDVVGAYVSSAVSASEKKSDALEILLRDYLQVLMNVRERIGRLPQVFEYMIANEQHIAFEWLLEASISAQIVAESVLSVARKSGLADKFNQLCLIHAPRLTMPCSVEDAWRSALTAVRQKRDHVRQEFDYLRSRAVDLNTIEDQHLRLNELRSRLRSRLDQDRLQRIVEIQEQVISYTKQNSYVERERLAYIVTKTAIPNLLGEIEANPTIYSIEQFYSYLKALQEALHEHFERIQRQAEPQELMCRLPVERYPDQEEINCQIEISNVEGKSPVSELVVHVAPSPNNEYQLIQQSVPINVTLEGGRSVTCQVPIRLTPAARAAQVLTLHYDLSYTLRSGSQASQTDLTLPIRLYNAEDFKPIHNPYAVYASGRQVEDDRMFYGRDRLIENLKAAILSAPVGKSVVIFGQKRTGKSSVLYHLKRRLPEQFIPIQFSVGDIANDPSVRTFLYRIIQELSNALEERFPKAFEAAERPKLSDLSESPELIFNDYMNSTLRQLRAIQPEARLILLLDEFSYLYSEIQAGTLPRTFMRFWKALTERGYFSTVLVGQDSMPRFMEVFPNEFQVAQPERVTYLADEDARRLIEEPIRIPETGESRYRGRAVERLLQLTAGSPYYIQIFCNRLVEYMNSNRAIYVTDADIERVKQELLRGQNRLTDGQFDNLLSSADEYTNLISAADARAVLTQIAQHTRHQDWCDAGRIQAHTSKPLAEVLEDLVRREVLEKQNDNYRIRVGLFKEWLLEN